MPGPLHGVTVLDFSRVLTGPHCTRLLCDLGADVIKVEPPQGDLTRFFVPRVGSMGVYFAQQNTGKRNVSVDLDQPEAVELLLRLVPQMDVVVENFRPGVMDRLGLGYAHVCERNPRIVYTSITGYGQDGPWRDRPAYAPTVHADMGYLDAMARTRRADPDHDHFSHADLYAAIHGAVGILAALYDRERTGSGRHVDVAMAEAMLSASEHLAPVLVTDQDAHTPLPGDGTQMYRTGDGRWVTVAGDPAPRGTFQSWCTAMGRSDLADDPRFASDEDRRANREALLEIIRAWIAGFEDLEELDAALQKGRLVLGVVRTLREAATSPWAQARGAIVEVPDRSGGTLRVPNAPWRFTGADTGVHGEPAFRGEHNREVFRQFLGLDEAELDRLEADGILSHRPPRSPAG